MHYVALHDLQRSDGETSINELTSHQKDLRDTITFIPSHTEARGWTVPADRSNMFTAVYLDPRLVPDELTQGHDAPRLYFKDRDVTATLKKLGELITTGGPDSLHAETLGLLLWIELGSSAGSRRSSGRARGLSAAGVSEIRDYVEANLHSDITLAELAHVAELSRYHFIRAFRQSTGLPPYQYLLLRRIERAKEMLRSGVLLNEVALSVGFPNADSFGRTFRRMTGLTPKQYERKCTDA